MQLGLLLDITKLIGECREPGCLCLLSCGGGCGRLGLDVLGSGGRLGRLRRSAVLLLRGCERLHHGLGFRQDLPQEPLQAALAILELLKVLLGIFEINDAIEI